MPSNLSMDVRSTQRSHCRIDSKIHYLNQNAEAHVLNVSRTGMALELYGKFNAATGSNVSIENIDIGLIEGTIRWRRNGRIGVQIKQTSNTLAQISSYFRHFHKETRPVLTR
ncbi:MAG: PilZ domain-containing protein [Allorhizobium sp.]